MNEKLTYIDISDAASYHTGPGLKQVNGGRKVNDTKKFKWNQRRGLHFSGGELGSVVMGHFSSYSDYIAKFAADPNNLDTMRNLGKYGERECESLMKKLPDTAKGKKALRQKFQRIKDRAEALIKSPDPKKLNQLKLDTSDAIKELDGYLDVEIPKILEHNRNMLKRIGKKSDVNLKSVGKIQDETTAYFKYLAMKDDVKAAISAAKQATGTIIKDKTKDAISSEMKKNEERKQNNPNSERQNSSSKPKRRIIRPSMGNGPSYPQNNPNKNKKENPTLKPKSTSTNNTPKAAIPKQNPDGSWSN